MTHRAWLLLLVAVLASIAGQWLGAINDAAAAEQKIRTFQVRGTIREIKSDRKSVVIAHEKIPDYMGAMTMPFRVKSTNELSGLRIGDIVSFRLSVTESESWIDRISKIGSSTNAVPLIPALSPSGGEGNAKGANVLDGLSAYTFINEFGRPMNFREYRGQAIALTFFFTHCPIPDYCPRLTKNFLAATRKLEAMPNAPTNWHLFSISFDTENDTPDVLRAYGKGWGYDSNRWTFLTASPQTISAVTRNFGFGFKKEGGLFTHEFLTVVLDANGYTQAGWPVGGDTSDMLVEQIVKGASIGAKEAPSR